MTTRRALGKGLDSLLGDSAAQSGANRSEGFQNVPIELLKPNTQQPRRLFDEEKIQNLAESMKITGIINPLTVRRLPDNTLEIVAGERRWRAAQIAGLATVPVIIDQSTDAEALVKGLVENIQREDLNPIEQAAAMQHLQDEYGLTQEQIAAETGKSRAAISNLARLLGLPKTVQGFVRSGELDAGKARVLLSLPESLQVSFAKKAISKGLTVRQLEAQVKKHGTNTQRKKINPDVERLQNELAETLGSEVSITQRAKRGGGYLRIQYRNLEQLNSIIERIKKDSTQPSG